MIKLIWAFLAVTALVFASPIVEQMLDTIVIEAAIGQTCFQRHGYNFVSRWSCRSSLHSFGYPALAASCFQKKNDFCMNFERILKENDEAGIDDKRSPQGKVVTGSGDKRSPQRKAATGNEGRSEVDALRARLMALWSPPVGVKDPNELIVTVNIKLRPDGRLAAPPLARVNGSSVAAMASRDSAVRAVLTGQPFDMLKPEHYETWKEIEFTFDPKDMFRSN